jgi:cytochrome c oxidase accessory protein FixG
MEEPQVAVIQMYAAREQIYPREASGPYARLRWLCVWLTQMVFYGLPWFRWNDRQAVLFDLGARKFYLFGVVLWPQDFIYLAALLIICAYLLFLVTAIAGRVWCGFACPQTVYTEIFLWIERQIEGTRSARMRLDKQSLSTHKLVRKTAKHAAWLSVALWTGFSFVGYFTPIRELASEVMSLGLGPWEWFWILFYSLATYGNAGWLREQVCKYMCPYARFQSSMFDKDTLIITYDQQRGEPRGAWSEEQGSSGDCIDCTLCVQVCPTGIDIRKGLQYECIGCAACIDACDGVMQKVQRPQGLIRYSTDHAVENNLSLAQIRRRAFRPRVLIYCAILCTIVVVFFSALALRMPLKLDVIRDRGAMGRELESGQIENVYRLQIMNTSEVAHDYRVSVSGNPTIRLAHEVIAHLDSTMTRAVPVSVRIEQGSGHPGSNKINFVVTAIDAPELTVSEKAVFFVPH